MPMLHYICIAKFLTGSHHHFLLELTSGLNSFLVKKHSPGKGSLRFSTIGSQKKCFPTSQAVTLPKSQVKLNVIHFNSLEQMFSLLSDTTLIKTENLLTTHLHHPPIKIQRNSMTSMMALCTGKLT
jgi:hypothetical protein